jgi:hypothetical protein
MSDLTLTLEKHYTTSQAADLLASSVPEIERAIRDKKIFARKRTIRGSGKRGRYAIPESEIRRILGASTDTKSQTSVIQDRPVRSRVRRKRVQLSKKVWLVD